MYPAGGRPAPASPPPPPPPVREMRGSLGGFPGLTKENKTTKSANLVEGKDSVPGVCGTGLPLNSFFHQTSHACGLEFNCSVKKTFHSPEDRTTSGGVFANAFYKDHYKAAMEQLAALNLSNNTRTPELNSNSKQRPFYSWSYRNHQGSNSVSRDFKKPLIEVASGSNDAPIHINTNPLVHSFMKTHHSFSNPEAQKTMLENYCRNGDVDFSKKANEVCAADSYPTTDSSSDDMSSVLKWNLKKGNSNVEQKFSTEEKDMCESEKKKKALLNYLKNVNINLKPEPIEHKEGTSSSVDSNTFSYPDFLPPPYNTLDLQKISKCDDWRACLNAPVDAPIEKLISRLVEMERLQHLTVLREGTKETVSPTMAFNNRTGSSKDVYPLKLLKPSNLSCPQTTFDGDPHSFGCCMHEPSVSKYVCQHCHSKWNSGASSSVRSPTKNIRAFSNTCKCPKASVTLDSSNVVTQRSLSCPGSSSKIQPGIKTTYPKSLSPSTTVASSLPDNESTKSKQQRTKRKSCRKNGALMSKPFHAQRLKSLSFTSKQNCSHIDHQWAVE
nr:protein FAM217A isoform X2 [Pogona vitticeps]